MNSSQLKSAVVACLAGFIVLHALILWNFQSAILQGYGDFTSFYTAGKILQQGKGKQLYDPALQWQIQQDFAFTVEIRRGPLPFVRPPFEALLFLPLAYLSYPAAYLVWTATKILILFAIPLVLRRIQRTCISPGGAVLVELAFFPIAFDLLQGQDAVLLLFLVSVVLMFLRQGKDLYSGILLGLGLFKFHLVGPIALIFLLRGKYRVVSGLLTTGIILLLFSAKLVGWRVLLAYPKHLWTLNRARGVGVITLTSMPNLRGFLAAFGAGQNSVSVAWWLFVFELLAIVFVAYVWGTRTDADPVRLTTGFSLSLVVIILTSYYVYCYDMSLLVIPILLLGGSFLPDLANRPWFEKFCFGCFCLLLCSPVYWALIFYLDRFYWTALLLLLMAGGFTLLLRSGRITMIVGEPREGMTALRQEHGI